MAKTFKEQLAESSEPINWWFELSYAQYLTVPRLVMQSMPLEWQQKMAVLLQEMDETFDWRPKEGQYWVRLKDANGRFADAPLEDYRRGSCEHLRLANKACSRRVPRRGAKVVKSKSKVMVGRTRG
jgi:hypothetical protein